MGTPRWSISPLALARWFMVCVAFIAGGINAQSASIAKKNGGTSAYVEHLASAAGGTLVSLLLLAASPWYRSSYWRLHLKNRPLV